MPVSERGMVDEFEAVSNSSGSIAGEQSLLEIGICSGCLRRHGADQIANGGNDIPGKRAKNLAVTQIAVGRKTRDYKFCFCIVEPSHWVLFPKRGENKAVRRSSRRAVGLERLRQACIEAVV